MSHCSGSAWPPAASISSAALWIVPGSFGLGSAVLAAIDDVRAVARGAQRDRQADAARRAGDEEGLALQIHRVSLSAHRGASARQCAASRATAPRAAGQARCRATCSGERLAAGAVDRLARMKAVARHRRRRRARPRSPRRETSLRVAAQRASAASWRRASAPITRRSGSGRSGKRSHRRQRREDDVARQPAGRAASRRARRGARSARRVGTWSITSLTPVMTTATSAARRRRRRSSSMHGARRQAGAGAARPTRSAARSMRCQRADQVADDRLVLVGDADAGGRRIAGDQQAQRRARRRAERGLRARPAASGSTGARRRVAQRLRDQQRRQRELERQGQRGMASRGRPRARSRSELARSRACASGRRH